MDLASFKGDLACAVSRPGEWRFDDQNRFLIHVSTGIRVSPHGQVYRSGTTDSPYHQICTTSSLKIDRLRATVVKREAEARRKNEVRDRKDFLDSFPGFRS